MSECQHIYLPIVFSLVKPYAKPMLVCTKCNDLVLRIDEDEEQ